MQKISVESDAPYMLLTKENGIIYGVLKSLLYTDISSPNGIKSEGSAAQIYCFSPGEATPSITLDTQIGKTANYIKECEDSMP